jgi:hypothetical protein
MGLLLKTGYLFLEVSNTFLLRPNFLKCPIHKEILPYVSAHITGNIFFKKVRPCDRFGKRGITATTHEEDHHPNLEPPRTKKTVFREFILEQPGAF